MLALNAPAAVTVNQQINDLRAHYLMLKKARADFELAQTRGKLGATEQDDYAAWITQLNDQVLQDCSKLIQNDQIQLPDDLPCGELRSTGLAPVNINMATELTETEQTNGLITELDSTLGEFDERLLQEQQRVKAQTPRTESSGGGLAGGSAGAIGNEGGEQSEIPSGDEKQGETSAEQSQEHESEGGQSTSSQTGTPGKSMPGSGQDIPEDIPDGSDDDVVARQLREAAEKETDPELKKKLWEEYRRYKAGTS